METTQATPLVGIVVVSHSARLAEGIVELAAQMAGPDVILIPVGGAPGGGLGTDADRIAAAVRSADAGAGVVVLADLGSAILATESAIESLGPEFDARIRISGGPIAEGAVIASVQASIGESLGEVLAAAESARDLDKGVGR
jgi:PTS hybrid protein